MLRHFAGRGSAALLLICSPFALAQTTPAATEATTVATGAPTGVAYDAAGNLYIALRHDHRVVMVDTKGLITNLVGTGEQGYAGDGGPAASALLDSPSGLALDAKGNLYIADTRNNCIREVVNGVITTIAGTGVAGFSGDGGAPTSAQLFHPLAVSADSAGNLYIADSDNHRIRRISAGAISTVAGTAEQIFSGDGGPATSAGLDTPSGVAVDPTAAGRFFISDTHNQRIRMVDASGNISTVAGNGVKGFAGNGSAATAASLARPRGLAVDSAGLVSFADTDNNLIRTLSGTTIATAIGTGEQGFSGDTSAPLSSLLDTPTSVGLYPGGLLTISDTHNDRTRTLASSVINTVAGIAPALTEGIVLSGPISTTFGTGTITATFSNGAKTATGSASLLDGSSSAGTASFLGNQANFSLSALHAGFHVLAVTYPGDRQNAPVASGEYLITIQQAAETINFPQPPTPVIFGAGASTILTATSSSGLPVTFTVTGPATLSGATLTYTGPGQVVVTATAGNQDYATVSVSRTIVVVPVTVSGLAPASAPLGSGATSLTVTGTGFAPDSVILINGSPVQTSFLSSTMLGTTLPASTFTSVHTLLISVMNPTQQQTTPSLPFSVTAPAVGVSLSAPPTSNPGTQPTVTLTLTNPYPVAVAATLTLTFSSGALGVDDPAILFQNGKRTFTINLAAGATTASAVQIQTGTVAGTIQIATALVAGGVDVTPTTIVPTVITVPPATPTLTQVSLNRTGHTLTVTVIGYSDTRQATQAAFHFTPAAGKTLLTHDINLDVTTQFATWFAQAASNAYGSEFTYTQVFTLDDDASVVDQVTVSLSNSVGASTPATTP